MRKIGLIIAALAAILILAMCRSGSSKVIVPPSPAAETTLSIAQGDLIGFVAQNGAHVWRGAGQA